MHRRYRVPLTDDERWHLHDLTTRSRTATCIQTHACILLKTPERWRWSLAAVLVLLAVVLCSVHTGDAFSTEVVAQTQPHPTQPSHPSPDHTGMDRATWETLQVTPTLTTTTVLTIGFSVQQRPIQAVRIGTGSRVVVITGAIHGGTESNTSTLVYGLLERFERLHEVLPADLSLYIVPMINVDGVRNDTRYNANGVDLNRNWDSGDWQPDSFDSSGRVVGGGGSAPFSEPETAALSAWLLELRAQSSSRVLVIFYHAEYPPSGLVLPGSAGADITQPFANALGFAYSGVYSEYPVTGEAVSWCGAQQIGCFDVELPNTAQPTEADMELHTQAILSVLLLGQDADTRCFGEQGECIAGRIREFWEQHGGLSVFGAPITPQMQTTIEGQPLQVQWFERVRLELHPQNEPPYDVLVSRLGVERLEQQGRSWWEFPRSTAQDGCLFFAETQHNICGEMLEAWRSNGLSLDGQAGISAAESLALFGMPISDVQMETLSDGREYQVQWYERARLELHPENEPPYRVLFGLLGSEVYGEQ
jgi:hypothetical protein